MKKVSVLIVDDSALIRQLFEEMLSDVPDICVLGTACDPYDAREKIKQLNPDVLTLDIEMPKMDGISFLEKIMSLRPMPVIMVSSLTQKGAAATIRAFEIGAFDAIGKPVLTQTRQTIMSMKEELVAKIRAAASANIQRKNFMKKPGMAHVIDFKPSSVRKHVIAIGASTGGVEALRDIFIRLPENAPPIVITQHMPEKFTKSFAERLSSLSQVVVHEAENHMRLQLGHAYLAPGSFHLRVAKVGQDFVCKVDDGPTISGHKPSVDALFQSVAQVVGSQAVGVILTGMGKDGAEGMKAMREKGAYNIGQNQATCVVYGMPKVAHEMGAVQLELPIQDIAVEILRYCEKGSGK